MQQKIPKFGGSPEPHWHSVDNRRATTRSERLGLGGCCRVAISTSVPPSSARSSSRSVHDVAMRSTTGDQNTLMENIMPAQLKKPMVVLSTPTSLNQADKVEKTSKKGNQSYSKLNNFNCTCNRRI